MGSAGSGRGGLSASGMRLIGDLSNEIGIGPETIRFYEREGLVKPRRLGRMRVYDEADVERLKVIKFFRQFDLSVDLIRDLLKRHDSLYLNDLPQEVREELSKQMEMRRAKLLQLETLSEMLRLAPVTSDGEPPSST